MKIREFLANPRMIPVVGIINTLILIFLSVSMLPASDGIIDITGGEMLGTAVTTINGSDTLKDSRTVINDNFTALNTGKLELSTFYSTTTMPNITTLANLVTVGTITSGTWHGSVLDVAYGGTGTSSLTAKGVVLGNGTSGLYTVTAGSPGQLLTLNASGTPEWTSASFDTTQDYSFSGDNSFSGTSNFTGTTTISANAVLATTTITSLSVNGTSTSPLLNSGTTTLHYHPSYTTTFSKDLSEASYVGTTTITHNLGVTPGTVDITCAYGDSTTYIHSRGIYAEGVSNYVASLLAGGGGISTAGSGITRLYHAATAYQTGTLTLSATTASISWVKTNSPTATVYCSALISR